MVYFSSTFFTLASLSSVSAHALPTPVVKRAASVTTYDETLLLAELSSDLAYLATVDLLGDYVTTDANGHSSFLSGKFSSDIAYLATADLWGDYGTTGAYETLSPGELSSALAYLSTVDLGGYGTTGAFASALSDIMYLGTATQYDIESTATATGSGALNRQQSSGSTGAPRTTSPRSTTSTGSNTGTITSRTTQTTSPHSTTSTTSTYSSYSSTAHRNSAGKNNDINMLFVTSGVFFMAFTMFTLA